MILTINIFQTFWKGKLLKSVTLKTIEYVFFYLQKNKRRLKKYSDSKK